MTSEAPPQDAPSEAQDAQMKATPTGPAAATGTKKRPRLDLNANPLERKRGKSMFGLVLGTLNKAKIEDKERNASEAAKKRQLIEQRLQNKLRKETDSVRRAEEAKKDKNAANRKEEELQLKDSIHKLRRTRLPLLANFLLTSDHIPSEDSSPPPPSTNPLSLAPRSHPPPLYYLPAILTPAQEAFINRRKTEVKDAAEDEWETFREERSAGIDEVRQLRQRVADELERKKTERAEKGLDADVDADKEMTTDEKAAEEHKAEQPDEPQGVQPSEVEMDVDDGAGAKERETEKEAVDRKDEPASMQADDDDALEY